jgi:iron(III) transport system permease protein
LSAALSTLQDRRRGGGKPSRPSSAPALPRLRAVAWLGAGLVALPLIALVWLAATGDVSTVGHVVTVVLPEALIDTGILLSGVGVLVLMIGVGAAWLVTAFRFPGRDLLAVALMLPLAVPTYIVAYVYVELLEPLGPVQSLIRAAFGLGRADMAFPEIRSMPGAILLLGLVLYPYVYLPVRALFSVQSAGLLEAARTLGAPAAVVFRRIALPLARPAMALGLSLALLEALNDIGATDYLGVRTLTIAVYTTWLNRGSLPGAALIALVLLGVVLLLLLVESRARGARRFETGAKKPRPQEPVRLEGGRAALAFAACALPPLLGFAFPFLFLLVEAGRRVLRSGVDPALWSQLGATLAFAGAATLLTVGLGGLIAAATRIDPTRPTRAAARLAALGYALPGTVLAVALIWPLAGLDNQLATLIRDLTGQRAGLILTSTGLAVVIAYVIRFLGIAVGGIETGYSRISPHMDAAARTLGRGPGEVMREIHLPLVRPALASAALMVFVDSMKELPATLLLRPLNIETLATAVFENASRGVFEDGAVAALAIVASGLAPIILLMRASRATAMDMVGATLARIEPAPAEEPV